jgi:hypothetical protein
MNKKQLLEKLELYKGRLIKESAVDGIFICRCRNSHIFKLGNSDDWCVVCDEQEFKQEFIKAFNVELNDLSSVYQLYSVNKFGIGEFICDDGHGHTIDTDLVQHTCIECCESSNCGEMDIDYDVCDNFEEYDEASNTESDCVDVMELTDDFMNQNTISTYLINPNEDVHIKQAIAMSELYTLKN